MAFLGVQNYKAPMFLQLKILFILSWLQQLMQVTLQYHINDLMKEL